MAEMNELTTIESHHEFESQPSSFQRRRISQWQQEKKNIGTTLSVSIPLALTLTLLNHISHRC